MFLPGGKRGLYLCADRLIRAALQKEFYHISAASSDGGMQGSLVVLVGIGERCVQTVSVAGQSTTPRAQQVPKTHRADEGRHSPRSRR